MADRNHNPIHRAYNLMDRRATKEVEWLKQHIGEDRIFQVRGNRLEDHPTLVNLLWELSQFADGVQLAMEGKTIKVVFEP